jgi:hypothetical protein
MYSVTNVSICLPSMHSVIKCQPRDFFLLHVDLQVVNVVFLLSLPCFYVSGCLIHIGVICNFFV